ncbi:MAG TPA: hypothetical protein VK864_07780 [Longimicrobiales bacterium]|nr:hypothetical protein [Longimicrobiales bacterium]
MPEALLDRLELGIVQIAAFLPRLAAALGILMAGFAIAKMIERGTDLGLHKIGFDRWMREGGVTEALARAGTRLDPSSVLAKLTFWTLMVLVIVLAADALGIEAVNALFGELLGYILNVMAAVIVLVLGILLGEFVKRLVLASAGGLHGAPTLARAAKGAIILLAAFMAIEQLDIAQDIVLVFFIAVVGAAALAAGIAFGLGSRDIAAEVTREWYERNQRQHATNPDPMPPAAVAPREGEPGTPPPGERRS